MPCVIAILTHSRVIATLIRSLDALLSSEPDASLYALSEPCAFGDVHVFVSHSWSDSPSLKWEALQQWRSKFQAKHQNMEPRLFLDPACINHARLLDSLACLPVRAAASMPCDYDAGIQHRRAALPLLTDRRHRFSCRLPPAAISASKSLCSLFTSFYPGV
ncbi:hypothetical protein T492DRAFT_136161 [Pavlovales sp. CCMP2436]|nr:hypothetical protein T492DRAFT_136161 [Pavlovales sp. CCMP2436]